MKGEQFDKTILEMCRRNIIILTLKGKEKYYEFTPEFKAVMKQVKEYEGHIQKDKARFIILCLLEHCERLTEEEMIPMEKVLSTMFQQRGYSIKMLARNKCSRIC